MNEVAAGAITSGYFLSKKKLNVECFCFDK